jgi:hypothetical protein
VTPAGAGFVGCLEHARFAGQNVVERVNQRRMVPQTMTE